MAKTTTGVSFLDSFLNGGYEKDAINTIYGPAGTGKTNLAVLAALATAKQGKKVIYVDTEGGFNITRLKQICANYKKALNNILFLKPTTFEEQKQAIEKLKELTKNKIGLIIVDTITMLYRLERSFKEDSYNRDLGNQMITLNQIARKRKIPVLVTSQVYSSFDSNAVKIVGGDILSYISKSLIELEAKNGKRKISLRKHRSMARKETEFKITEKGIEN